VAEQVLPGRLAPRRPERQGHWQEPEPVVTGMLFPGNCPGPERQGHWQETEPVVTGMLFPGNCPGPQRQGHGKPAGSKALNTLLPE